MNRFLSAAAAAILLTTAACGSSGGGGTFSGKVIVADGKEGVDGLIYTLNPQTGEIEDVAGFLDRGLTALVATPEGIFGVTSYLTGDDDVDNLFLYRFDEEGGELVPVLIGNLDEIADEEDGDAPGYAIAGLVYDDGLLYGYETDAEDPDFFSIDPVTGVMENLGEAVDFGSYGAGIATADDDTVYGILNEYLVTVDLADGTADDIAEWDNTTDDASYITDLTFVDGRLLGLVVYEEILNTYLVEIDLETGDTEILSELPPSIAAITYIP